MAASEAVEREPDVLGSGELGGGGGDAAAALGSRVSRLPGLPAGRRVSLLAGWVEDFMAWPPGGTGADLVRSRLLGCRGTLVRTLSTTAPMHRGKDAQAPLLYSNKPKNLRNYHVQAVGDWCARRGGSRGDAQLGLGARC
jgi:hypothetical protein